MPEAGERVLALQSHGFSGMATAGQVVNTCQYEAWFHLSPAVVKDVESCILE
jgi:hypothetical protein